MAHSVDAARNGSFRREHIAELNKRAAETGLRLQRLHDAIESGVADLNDPALNECIAGLGGRIMVSRGICSEHSQLPAA